MRGLILAVVAILLGACASAQAPTEQQYLTGGGGGITNGGLFGQMATLRAQVEGLAQPRIPIAAQHLPGNLNWVIRGQGTCDPSAQYGTAQACLWNNQTAMNDYTDGLVRAGIQGIDINFDPYPLSAASEYMNKPTSGNAAFTGAGLNDLAAGGPYTGGGNLTYLVRMSGTGTPDTFAWCSMPAGSPACAPGNAKAITAGAPEPLSNGIAVTFQSATGHTLNDTWEITALASDCGAPPSWYCLTLRNYDAMFAHVAATRSLYGQPLSLRLRPKPDTAVGPCGISTSSTEADLEACLKPLHVASVARWGSLLSRFTVLHEAFGGFGGTRIPGGRLMDIVNVPFITALVGHIAAAIAATAPSVKVGAGAETMFQQDAQYFSAYLGIPQLNYVETDLYGSTCDVGLYDASSAAEAAGWAKSAKAAGKEIVLGESARPRMLSVNPPCGGAEETFALIGGGDAIWGADGADAVFESTMIPWCAAQGYTLFTIFDGGTLIWYTTNAANSKTYDSSYPMDLMSHLSGSTSTGQLLAQKAKGPAAVSAADGATPVSPGSIVSIYGSGLASSTAAAKTLPLPTSLGGASASITDSAGASAPVPLFYASPLQINAEIPASAASGTATLTIQTPSGAVSIVVALEAVAPGLFSANASGAGVAAAQFVTTPAGGSQTIVTAFECASGAGTCTPVPIDLGPTGTSSALVLYGTGIRNRAALSDVTVTVGSQTLSPFFAGAAPTWIGLDQVNVALPHSLAGSGTVNVSVSVAGSVSNAVQVTFK